MNNNTTSKLFVCLLRISQLLNLEITNLIPPKQTPRTWRVVE